MGADTKGNNEAVIPTVENFAEMLREEVHTLRVMYRIGVLRLGYTAWGHWIEGDIKYYPAAPDSDNQDAFKVVSDSPYKLPPNSDAEYIQAGEYPWQYVDHKHAVEAVYQDAFEGGYVFGRDFRHPCLRELCIQIVFMDARNQHRRATRNIKRSK